MKTIKTLILSFIILVGITQSSYSGDVLKGKKIFDTTCFACHGKDGKGALPGIPDFTGKKSPLSKDIKELKKHVWNGYQGKSAIAMPPKGGKADMTKQELDDVLAFLLKEFSKK